MKKQALPKGLFITFEGPEGAGKTTQIKLLKNALVSHGFPCITTREPGGTEVAEQLRDIVKHHSGEEPIVDETELLLFAASRAQHVRNLILPALANGTIVLCDRFYDSTTAYQGYARKQNMEFINQLNQYAICNCVPNLTILMDLPPEKGFERANHRQALLFNDKEDRIEAESMSFHQAVRDGFLSIAANEPDRVKVVDAAASIDEIHANILEVVNDVFNLI